jgi:magnesium transporter
MQELLLEQIEQNNFKEVKSQLLTMHVQDIADLLEKIESPASLIKVFKLLPKDMGAEVFSYVEDSDIQEKLVSALSDKELGYLIDEMYIDDAVDFVEEMPANVVERALKVSDSDTRALINKFLKYEEYSAGSIMTTEFIDVKENMSCAIALKRIKKVAINMETINYIYVVDHERILKGVASIRDLIVADDDEKIKDIMNENVISATTDTDQEEIARLFRQYGFLVLPIVDREHRLVGIVTVDDIIEVIDEEATEDISKMAAVTPTEKPYLKTSAFRIWLTRVPWLMLLMISATFTGLIIADNEATLSSGIYGILLTSCIPMIMGTGGNAGGQASATIIRGIAVSEICFKDFLKVVWKEFRVSILLGVSLSIVCFLKILLLDGVLFGVEGVDTMSALIISLSMLVTIIMAKFIGASLPLIAKKCKLDPAVMASPFITTILDILSLLVYCFLATNFLM